MSVPDYHMLAYRTAGQRAWRLVGGQSGLRETLDHVGRTLRAAGIPHAYVGSVALAAYGVCQVTDEIDICVRNADLARLHDCLAASLTANERSERVRQPRTMVRAVAAGTPAHVRGTDSSLHMPDPAEAVWIDDAPLPRLARLIELELAAGRYRDWSHVVELIRIHGLAKDFADQLDPTVRPAYLRCCDQKIEEDRYNPEMNDQARE